MTRPDRKILGHHQGVRRVTAPIAQLPKNFLAAHPVPRPGRDIHRGRAPPMPRSTAARWRCSSEATTTRNDPPGFELPDSHVTDPVTAHPHVTHPANSQDPHQHSAPIPHQPAPSLNHTPVLSHTSGTTGRTQAAPPSPRSGGPQVDQTLPRRLALHRRERLRRPPPRTYPPRRPRTVPRSAEDSSHGDQRAGLDGHGAS